MLQIKDVRKVYRMGDVSQTALDGVSFNLRDNEFVSILGPSGSGKTTLLNAIGGLDKYTSGDIIINGISTKKYTSRDWDSYRNHTIGFIFQGYNLIQHQTILANVELALSIAGVSGSERKKRAEEALKKVGLGEFMHKRPNQMSGGQMQRVAIARALVNDPDILLADEPTGALDSATSVQIMELLKEIAKDKLVVMVTHNQELAEQYSTRIINLADGKIVGDTDPYEIDEAGAEEPKHKNMGKSSMSFFTSLGLSFNNLKTKKGRTFLTAFAGSIGIIGIALIIALSSGVNRYVETLQKDTMVKYPITVNQTATKASTDTSALTDSGPAHELDAVYANASDITSLASESANTVKNNLNKFKKYLDDPSSEINKYIGENGIIYSYNVSFGVYAYDKDNTLVNTNGVTIGGTDDSSSTDLLSALFGGGYSNGIFQQMAAGQSGELISKPVTDSYEVVNGSWPSAYDEVVLVLDENNEISVKVLYELGVLPSSGYADLLQKAQEGDMPELSDTKVSYDDILKQPLYLIPACDQYIKGSSGTFTYIGNNAGRLAELTSEAIKLKISGIIRPVKNAKNASITNPIGFTSALTDKIIEKTNESAVVKAQEASPKVSVLTGLEFAPADDAAKLKDLKEYISKKSDSEKADIARSLIAAGASAGKDASSTASMSDKEAAELLDTLLSDSANKASLLKFYNSTVNQGTYEDTLKKFGVVDKDTPSSISIYADNFDNKEGVISSIDDYNKNADKKDQIVYTDSVAAFASMLSMIVNVISYVLIAFVAVSLIVSSIMIGIITYISVLERTKEIGILRALGASKRNVSQVFNAETFLVGLFAGIIGVAVTLLLLLPINFLIHAIAGTNEVSASLPPVSALILIALSIVLTLIGGIIPAKKAAAKDPVEALRSE